MNPIELHLFLRHNPSTGQLIWKERPREMFQSNRAWNTWNSRFSGKIAFTSTDTLGYKQGAICGKQYRAHRVIWAMEYGYWPNIIDHINGDGTDNRIDNLRDVCHMENLHNQKRAKDNTSGITGVCWDKCNQRWIATICVNTHQINLGRYDNIEEASNIRKAAEIKYGFHENHGRTDRTS